MPTILETDIMHSSQSEATQKFYRNVVRLDDTNSEIEHAEFINQGQGIYVYSRQGFSDRQTLRYYN